MEKIIFNEETKEKLKGVVGEELKYIDLCRRINLPVKRGNAKTAQLNNLSSYCDIIKISGTTKYVIKEVYDVAFEVITRISNNDKFQTIFDGILFQALLDNKGYPLYASGLELVELFQEVNRNFAVTLNSNDLKKIGEDYLYMAEMSEIVYTILYQWTKRKIESMSKRGIIRLGSGYRVYTEHKSVNGNIYLTKYNVPVSTSEKINELDKLCDKIYLTTKEDILPPRKKIDKETGEIKLSNYYPEYKLIEFDREINRRIREETNGRYCKMKKVNVILPPYDEWMINKLKEIYNAMPDFKEINQEACRKILETTQLDRYTNEDRKKFILFNMSQNPPFIFRQKIEEKERNNLYETK